MRAAILLLASLLGACGRIETPPEDVAPPSLPPDADAAPPPVAAAPTLEGYVSLWHHGGTLDATASFPTALRPGSGSLGRGCTLLPDTRIGAVEEYANVGDVVIESGAAKVLTLSYDAAKRAYEPASIDEWVLGGPPIRVRAGGAAGVPAFDATVAAATEVRLEAPLEGAEIDPDGGDLEVRWSKTEAPLFVVALRGPGHAVDCSFPSGAGQGVIPSALVRQAMTLPPGTKCPTPCLAGVAIISGRTTRVIAGRYDVFVTHGTQVGRSLTIAE